MTAMASQITSLMIVYSTVYSGAYQRKHQSSASLAFVWGIHRDRWIPRTKGQLRGKCFHLMTSSWVGFVGLKAMADVINSRWIIKVSFTIFALRFMYDSANVFLRLFNMMTSWSFPHHWHSPVTCSFNSQRASDAYVVRDLFPAYLFFRRRFHAIVIFRFKSISDLDSGSLPRFVWWIHIRKIKKRGVVTTTEREMARNTLTSG